ncbi:NAD(P)/FAD-dependent oxidoreductase [Modestobacter sp. Leaf380]|uniref:FAD-dependent oxidoreductase n=1 Tax=Modestobacter sp. Leaf380 TaxID=1736356 RepID=UPI0006F2713A|nr:NAD(P)/FAD-dependent oxidoreductase [Modestobacter sp. Leaf380]KQS73686.1 FAD-binding monooxygenase [Modestobacter sp. Leaf380]
MTPTTPPPRTTDVLVVGAGLAGLQAATGLARLGHDVQLVDRRPSLAGAIRTTGIFVRKTLDDYDLPADCLGPPIRRVVLYPPSTRGPVELLSHRDEYRVGDMAGLYAAAARAAVRAGVRLTLGTRYVGRDDAGVHRLEGPDGPARVRARFLVGADGARSRVARELGLDRNERLLVGAEEVWSLPARDVVPTFHCVLDPRLAPGYLAWVVDDGRHAHVGVAGHAERFPDGMRGALTRFSATAPGLPRHRSGEVERRGGPIPVGGLLRRIGCAEGLLVGDAAGAVSPLTAGGLDPCLRLSDHAVAVLDEALRTGRSEPLRHYDGAALRRSFRGRLSMRRGLSALGSPALTELAFTALRTPPGRAVARRVLFGDRSFPDAVSGARAAGRPARTPAVPVR